MQITEVLFFFLSQLLKNSLRFSVVFALFLIPFITLGEILGNELGVFFALGLALQSGLPRIVFVSVIGGMIIAVWNTLGLLLSRKKKP